MSTSEPGRKKGQKKRLPPLKPDKGRVVKALFQVGKHKRFLKIRLGPSTIPDAGTGAFAVDPIPKRAKGVYVGVRKSEENANAFYSWEINEFDPETGEANEEGPVEFCVDATNPKKANWARYVNCGPARASLNLTARQEWDKMFYVATRNIEPGEELFIDYGKEYRVENLGMTGPY